MNDLKKMTLFPKDLDFKQIEYGMKTATDQMRLYAEMDMKATMFMFRRLYKRVHAAKPKSHACGRTMSWAKYAGSRMNKPKHNWSKKKRARMGWKV